MGQHLRNDHHRVVGGALEVPVAGVKVTGTSLDTGRDGTVEVERQESIAEIDLMDVSTCIKSRSFNSGLTISRSSPPDEVAMTL